MRAAWLLALGGVLATPLLAQDATTVAVPGGATAQGDVAVTIYQNGQSLVQDTRKLSMPRDDQSRNFLMFPHRSAPKPSP